jgi:WD40 repeat protein
LAFSPSGGLLASAGADGTLRLWSFSDRESVTPAVEAHAPLVTLDSSAAKLKSVAFSPDGAWLATGGTEGRLEIWQVSDRKPLLARNVHQNTIYAVAFHPDGRRLATASYDRSIHVWNIFASE